MSQELFKVLPSEIIICILSKLPIRSIIICKCVCKSWLHLVETQEFVKSHLSTSVPGLVTLEGGELWSSLFKFFEFEDGRDAEHHDLHYNLVTKFDSPYTEWICGSVDGLLWLRDQNPDPKYEYIYICNPITRDMITIHCPPEFPCTSHLWVTYGFGLCKMTGQYKLVRMLLTQMHGKEMLYGHMISIVEIHVYTLGTGFGWRRLAPCALHCSIPETYHTGAFVNGNLHWLGFDLKRCLWISCFDLATESFSTFSGPPVRGAPGIDTLEVFAWGGSLCLRDNTHGDDIVIWLMEEYGNAESWTKKLVINRDLGEEYYAFIVYPLKIFKDGDILMGINYSMLYYYSSKSKTTQQVDMFKVDHSSAYSINAISHTPSFISLKSFGVENVSSL